MRGLVVIGSGPEAGEPEAAARLCDAAGAAGMEPARFAASAFEGAAPPAIAARHAGAPIAPAELIQSARGAADGADLLVAATSGGLLAPLATHYANRDLVRELHLPIVVAARAGDGLLNHAMLTLEAAAGSNLPVAAVVVTGWPEPPGRVLLDERELLAEAALVPVVMTADWQRWPVPDWLEASPPATPQPEDAPRLRQVQLEPYRSWEPHPTGDPRSTPRPEIMATMLEIVGAEGPMTATRAYSLYNRAAGGRKLTAVARAPLSSAVYWLARENKIMLTRKDDIPWQDDDLVRMPDSPAVRVRELGPRALDEVPLDEVAELMGRVRSARGLTDAASLKRAVLDCYSLVRLTTRADEYLGLAFDLAGSPV